MTTAGEQSSRPRFVSNAPSLGFVPPFDGYRGMAVVLVVVVHAASEQLAGFAPLVDTFFIISGFLITTLLLQEDRSEGRISLRTFFQRRVARLFPVMYTVLAATLVFGLLVGDKHFRDEVISDVTAAAIYMYHVIHPVNETLITGQGVPPGRPLIHLWSLSVEEHFYLFGAVLTIIVVRFRLVKLAVVGFLSFWLFVTIARATGYVGWRMMWYQRPDAIAIGVAMAYINGMMPPELSETTIKRIRVAGVVGLGLLLGAMLSGTVIFRPLGLYVKSFPAKGHTIDDTFVWGQYGYSMANFGAALLVLSLVRGGDFWLVRAMSGKMWRALGRRSYIIYLLHIPLFMILEQWSENSEKKQALTTIAYLPLLAAGTELAHRFIEKPAVRRFRPKPKAAVAA